MSSGEIPRTVLEKHQFWRQVIDGHAVSGLSVPDWCRQRKVSESEFYAWKRKLARKVCEPSGLVPRFAQLVVSDASAGRIRTGPGNDMLSIDLGDARIEVSAGFDAATLRVVLEAWLPVRVRSGLC
ncbi:hypothetical protein GC170_06600 [bacterium]|nr:hypothetical protein [bacterium]